MPAPVRPCLRPLRRERALPSSVLGPVLLRAFRRLASSWAGEQAIGAVPGWFVRWDDSPGHRPPMGHRVRPPGDTFRKMTGSQTGSAMKSPRKGGVEPQARPTTKRRRASPGARRHPARGGDDMAGTGGDDTITGPSIRQVGRRLDGGDRAGGRGDRGGGGPGRAEAQPGRRGQDQGEAGEGDRGRANVPRRPRRSPCRRRPASGRRRRPSPGSTGGVGLGQEDLADRPRVTPTPSRKSKVLGSSRPGESSVAPEHQPREPRRRWRRRQSGRPPTRGSMCRSRCRPSIATAAETELSRATSTARRSPPRWGRSIRTTPARSPQATPSEFDQPRSAARRDEHRRDRHDPERLDAEQGDRVGDRQLRVSA